MLYNLGHQEWGQRLESSGFADINYMHGIQYFVERKKLLPNRICTGFASRLAFCVAGMLLLRAIVNVRARSADSWERSASCTRFRVLLVVLDAWGRIVRGLATKSLRAGQEIRRGFDLQQTSSLSLPVSAIKMAAIRKISLWLRAIHHC